MIHHLIALCLLASTAALAQTPPPAPTPSATSDAVPAGFRTWRTPATAQHPALNGGLWYPAASAGRHEKLFDNAIFEGVSVQPEAKPQPGRRPLVLLSHGVGGHWRSLAWLGAGLAQQGAVVVGVNHPGSTFGDYTIGRSLQHGSRVMDLQITLDALLADPVISPTIDVHRIYAAGFSLGGWTALSIAGLRGDLKAYAGYCATSGHRHCRDIQRAGIDWAQMDQTTWNRSYRDRRIQAVAAIDPAMHQGLSAEHARDMTQRVLLIGLGQGENRLPDTDFSAPGSALTQIVPQARVEVLAPAMHFSALPVCKPAGPELLAEEGDDPVCSDPPGTDRPALHQRIIHAIARHFGLSPN